MDKELKPCPTETGVGKYCVPAKEGKDGDLFYVLKFEDQERDDLIFKDRSLAREVFAKAEVLGWNCNLFEPMLRQEASIKADGEMKEMIFKLEGAEDVVLYKKIIGKVTGCDGAAAFIGTLDGQPIIDFKGVNHQPFVIPQGSRLIVYIK